MAGSDRAIGALKLFTLERPDWTVDQVAAALAVSPSSAYRYVATLEAAGLLTAAAGGRYRLGPAIIQYDRQLQLTDPLLQAARPVMAAMLRDAPPGSTVLLCRLFGDTVLCVHQAAAEGAQQGVSYERGRPMPLFRGATSKAILAHLPPRDLRRLLQDHPAEIAAARLGDDWPSFRNAMAGLRRAGPVITRAEVDAGRIGVAAAILAANRQVLGSLSYVLTLAAEAEAGRLAGRASDGARQIGAALSNAPQGAYGKPDGDGSSLA